MTGSTLDVRGVTKRFGDGAAGVEAVRGVSFSVDPGEIVLIMGPSGSGKTTLLSMMGALLKPTAGSIHLGGTEISALSERRLPDIRLREFGFIFQDFNLLSALTVLENVAIVAELAGLKGGTARDRATALLTDLGLGERLGFLPEKLSGGEKQRVAIARALVNDPTLVLADEPTANLDSKIGHEIMNLLRRIAKDQGRSVVIVSHDQRIRDFADRVLWLEDGAFRDIVGMASDPVCGMSVERERAVTADRDGETFFFCSRGCREEFLGRLEPHSSNRVDSDPWTPRSIPVGLHLHRKESGMSDAHAQVLDTQVVDPVCGMAIDREEAVAVTYRGVAYDFCEAACAEIFRDEPERWIDGQEPDPLLHSH